MQWRWTLDQQTDRKIADAGLAMAMSTSVAKRRIESLLLITNIAVLHVNSSIAVMYLKCVVCTCADSRQLLA